MPVALPHSHGLLVKILDVAFNVDPGAQNVLLAVHTVLADNPANLGRS